MATSGANVSEDQLEELFDSYASSSTSLGDRTRCTKPRRSPMGSYIVPKGGKPLTSLARDCIPAPSDYSPKIDLIKPSAQKYSIAGPWRTSKRDNFLPSPADYHTESDIIWNHKSTTIKGKGKMCVTGQDPMNNSIGPASYKVENFATGRDGRKIRIADRETVSTGPPDKLVQPVDTHGHNTPGPNHRPNSSYWGRGPKKSIGTRLKEKRVDRPGPGPAEYTIHDLNDPKIEKAGFKYSFGIRFPSPLQWRLATHDDSPAPNTYNLGTTVGSAIAKSISGRQPVLKNDFVPAPNKYHLPDKMQTSSRSCTMTYRSFDCYEGPHPSPAHYTINKVSLKKAPAYSLRLRLKYHAGEDCSTNPAPGEYCKIKKFTDNDGPAYSMGKRGRSAKNDVPGPNHYSAAKCTVPPNAKKTPSFSISKRFEAPDSKKNSPGPAAYSVKPPQQGPSYSMTKRPKSKKKMNTPAANSYCLKFGQNVKGLHTGPKATLKSRASPFVYSGINKQQIVEPSIL
ncbi:unnamed protein product [Owenia fusiformis]|uniref:Outer dense fiber protein 3 n=1 Tax=Owenia fusiformis TaxID=6347 RepID=A0A8S4NLU5_OWEFU|nr:unnamed protein product [Owenia fusiformis]